MPNHVHRVRCLRFRVRVGATATAFALRQRLHQHWEDLLLPVLQKAFDEIAAGGRAIRIPKIELRIRVDAEAQIVESLADQVYQQLKLHLLDYPVDPTQTDQKARLASPAREAAAQQGQLDILLHYLRSGFILWQAAHRWVSEIAPMLQETCRQERTVLLQYLRDHDETAPFSFRLFQMLSPEELTNVVQAIAERIPKDWRAKVVQGVMLVFSVGQTVFSRQTQLLLAATLLQQGAQRKGADSTVSSTAIFLEDLLAAPEREIFSRFLTSLPVEIRAIFQQGHQKDQLPEAFPPRRLRLKKEDATETTGISKQSNETGLPSDGHETAEEIRISAPEKVFSLDADVLCKEETRVAGHSIPHNYDAKEAEAAPESETNRNAEGFTDIYREADTQTTYEEALRRMFPATDNQEPTPPMSDLFPLTVYHAGLILLAPFISRFFESTGVKEAGQASLSSLALPRAAALLHGLASGEEEVYEYELGCIKVLLGLEPQTPLFVSGGLITPADREEATALLQSVIGYWEKLKNTSVEGLRSSFLQRPALLRKDENGFRLQVERQPFDILIDSLPWSISIIKLPWMTQALHTEW